MTNDQTSNAKTTADTNAVSLSPPADDNAVAGRAVAAKKSVSLLAFLPWLFLIVAAFVGSTYYAGIAGDDGKTFDAGKTREQDIEKLKNVEWKEYLKERQQEYNPHSRFEGTARISATVVRDGKTYYYYEFGPAREITGTDFYPIRTYRFADSSFFSSPFYNSCREYSRPACSIPYVYAEHWNLRRTPPVWRAAEVAGFNALNLEEDDKDTRVSINLMEKTLERIPLKDGADLSQRVFYQCSIEGYVPDFFLTDWHFHKIYWDKFYQAYTLAKLNGEYSRFDKTCFKDVTFKDCSFRYAAFDKGVFHKCTFAGCDFEECWFEDIEWSSTVIIGGNLKSCHFKNCNFFYCDFTNAPITAEQIRQTRNYKEGQLHVLKLPPDIQKVLDEERKAAKEKQTKEDVKKEK